MILQAANICRLTIREEVMLKSMLQHLCEARAEELEGEGVGEAGFTLIELMVVLLIIAILLAIAIPTFLGVTGSANDRAAQSNLTNALTEVSAVYQNQGQVYDTSTTNTTSAQHSAALVTAMGTSAPEFQWTASSVSTANNISIVVSTDDQMVIVADYSTPTKTCWEALATNGDTPGGSTFGSNTISQTGLTSGTWYAKKTAQSSCTATGFASGWAATYGAAPGS
jgi:type IV pilus assembly protein PilA